MGLRPHDTACVRRAKLNTPSMITALPKAKRLLRGNTALATVHANGNPAPKMVVRVGCRLVYETTQPVPILLVVRPRPENHQIILQEKLTFRCDEGAEQFEDAQGN